MPDQSDHALAAMLDTVAKLEEHVPGVSSWVGEIVVGKIPKGSVKAALDFADEWFDFAKRIAAGHDEVVHDGQALMALLSGESQIYLAQELRQYSSAVSASVEAANSVGRGVQSYALEIEMAKWMALLGLVMFIISVIQLLWAAFLTFGAAVLGLPAALGVLRATLWEVAAQALR